MIYNIREFILNKRAIRINTIHAKQTIHSKQIITTDKRIIINNTTMKNKMIYISKETTRTIKNQKDKYNHSI